MRINPEGITMQEFFESQMKEELRKAGLTLGKRMPTKEEWGVICEEYSREELLALLSKRLPPQFIYSRYTPHVLHRPCARVSRPVLEELTNSINVGKLG